MSSAICFNLDQATILSSGNELRLPLHNMITIAVKLSEFMTQNYQYSVHRQNGATQRQLVGLLFLGLMPL